MTSNRQQTIRVVHRLLLLLLSLALVLPMGLAPGYAASKKPPKTVLILMLHHFTDDPAEANYTTIDMKRLEQQIKAYQKSGYVFVKLSEVSTVDKPVVLSIDDGYESVYTHFYPMAKRLSLPFNLNLIMSRIGAGSDIEIQKASLDQLKDMKASGLCDLGVHSYDAHGFGKREGLVKLFEESWTEYGEAIRQDTQLATDAYLRAFGEAPKIYAYPYGSFSDYTQKMLKDMGFDYTLTTMKGLNRPEERHTLRRVNLN